MKQCMSDGNKFELASLDLTDGDVFMLHPEDKLFKTRKFNDNEGDKNVFEHALLLPIGDNADYLSVGIAFRCIPENHKKSYIINVLIKLELSRHDLSVFLF